MSIKNKIISFIIYTGFYSPMVKLMCFKQCIITLSVNYITHSQISVNHFRLVSELMELCLQLEAVGGRRRQVRHCWGGPGRWRRLMYDLFLCRLLGLFARKSSWKQEQITLLILSSEHFLLSDKLNSLTCGLKKTSEDSGQHLGLWIFSQPQLIDQT